MFVTDFACNVPEQNFDSFVQFCNQNNTEIKFMKHLNSGYELVIRHTEFSTELEFDTFVTELEKFCSEIFFQ